MKTEEFKQQAGELISQLEGIISKLTDIDQNIVLSSSLNEFKIVVDDIDKYKLGKPITAKNGENEWVVDGKTYIALNSQSMLCAKCVFFIKGNHCHAHGVPDCVLAFNESDVYYIEKP